MSLKRKKIPLIFFIPLLFSTLIACKSDESIDEDTTPEEEACFESGDIIVANSGSDAVTVLDSSGNFKRNAYTVNTSQGENFYGLDILASTGELLVSVDSGADRVMAIDPDTCAARIHISDVNLTGNLRGITQLVSGDILVVETSAVERFADSGVRITSGSWPKTLQTTSTQVSAVGAGGFVLCSSGADVVRTYDDAGTQLATRASGIAGTTDAMGCFSMLNGYVATAWSGTTDTVSIYNANLSSSLFTYSNPSVLGAPGGIGQRANGNLLVVDRVLHYIVELTGEGVFVGTLGSGLLNTPEHVLVVP